MILKGYIGFACPYPHADDKIIEIYFVTIYFQPLKGAAESKLLF